MSVCCIGGVCIPYSAIFPVVLLGLKWLAQKLASMGVLPDSIAQRLNLNGGGQDKLLSTDDCCGCAETSSDSSLSTAAAAPAGVTKIESIQAWKSLLVSHDYVACKYTATWCVPCRQIAPHFEQLAKEYATNKSVRFAEVDVDDLDEIAAQYNVAMMPTFMVFHKQKLAGTFVGSNAEKLRAFVQEHVVLQQPATKA